MRRASLGPWVFALALMLGAGLFSYTVDDAYVIGRYAQRLASGHGYTFVDGEATDGVTGPPFLAIGFIAAVLGMDPVAAAKGVGLLAAAAAAWLAVEAARRRVVGNIAAPVTAACLLFSPSYLLWSVAGLETGVATLCVIGLATSVLHTPRPIWAGISSSILVALRPECIPLAAALIGYLLLRHRVPSGRPTAAAALLPVVSLVLVIAGRWFWFGTWAPLSSAAKPPDLIHGLGYAFRIVTYGTALVTLAPAVYATFGSRRMRVLGVSILVHVVAIILAGGDWMPGVRLFVPAFPLLAWMVGVGVSDLARLRPAAITLRAAIIIVTLAPLSLFAFDALRAREAGEAREGRGRVLAHYLDEHAHRVALVDIGFLTYVGHFEPVDLAGITDPQIGHLPGGHVDKPVTGAMLIDRGVDALVLHSATEPICDAEGHLTALSGHPVERRLAMDENIRSAFVVAEVFRYAEAYWYVVLLRR